MIAKYFRRILRLLEVVGLIKKIHSVKLSGELPSTNIIYQSRHWTVRAKYEEQFTKVFRNEIFKNHRPPKADQFGIVVFYNNKFDVDNVTFIEKVFVDSLRRELRVTIPKDPKTKKPLKDPKTKKPIRIETLIYEGFVPNDDQRYFKFLTICPDKSLEDQTVEFNICIL